MKLTYSRKEACHELSIGTTKLHELINAGKLRTVKFGRKTVIIGESMKSLLESA